jgi:hypothetical protein
LYCYYHYLINEGYWSRDGKHGILRENININYMYSTGFIYLYSLDGKNRYSAKPDSEKYDKLISEGCWSKNDKHGAMPEDMKNHKNKTYVDQVTNVSKAKREAKLKEIHETI